MKTAIKDSLKKSQPMIRALIISVVILEVVMLIFTMFVGDNAVANIRIWLLYGVIAYIVLSGTMVCNSEGVGIIQFLFFINATSIVLDAAFFILHFFIRSSLLLQAIGIWWVFLLLILVFCALLFLSWGALIRRVKLKEIKKSNAKKTKNRTSR